MRLVRKPVARHALLLLVAMGAAACRAGENLNSDAAQEGGVHVEVSIDSGETSGSATAGVRIHATQEEIWELITSCPEVVRFVPGLIGCDVLETAADGSWARVRHVLQYSWYMPKLTYELRADYHRPESSKVERVAGDLRSMHATWTLVRDGDYTIANYAMDMSPGFWVPHWVIRAAFKRDLPKMMRALRDRAESLHVDKHE